MILMVPCIIQFRVSVCVCVFVCGGAGGAGALPALISNIRRSATATLSTLTQEGCTPERAPINRIKHLEECALVCKPPRTGTSAGRGTRTSSGTLVLVRHTPATGLGKRARNWRGNAAAETGRGGGPAEGNNNNAEGERGDGGSEWKRQSQAEEEEKVDGRR